VRHAVAWAALFWLWLLFVGQWNLRQWIAAAVAATIATAIGSVAVRAAGIDLRVPPAWIVKAWSVPAMVAVDFGILMWALVRRPRGVFVERPFEDEGDSVRAWATVVSGFSPNAYVVEIGEGRVVLHDLIRNRASESPI
jgi:hypothetical protein